MRYENSLNRLNTGKNKGLEDVVAVGLVMTAVCLKLVIAFAHDLSHDADDDAS